jgi:hypothetical protein
MKPENFLAQRPLRALLLVVALSAAVANLAG